MLPDFYACFSLFFLFVATQRPFIIHFKTDEDEVTQDPTTNGAKANEQAKVPGGIVGFYLNYALQDC